VSITYLGSALRRPDIGSAFELCAVEGLLEVGDECDAEGVFYTPNLVNFLLKEHDAILRCLCAVTCSPT